MTENSTALLETPTAAVPPDRPTLPRLGTVLGVWAHPDDEAYLSSGLMLHALGTGGRVVVVTATDGELGASDHSARARRRLGRRRRRELTASLDVLGVDEHHLLGYSDGGCSAADRERAVERLATIVDAVRPDTLVTFGPDGLTGHGDHRAVGSWTVEAAALAGHTGRLWFPTLTAEFHGQWSWLNDEVGLWMEPALVPTTPRHALSATLELTGEDLRRKMAALRAQESQTAALIEVVGEETYARWWGTEWFRDAEPDERWSPSHRDGGRHADH